MIPSLEGWPTKAKEAPSPHEVRLAPLDTNPVFQNLRGCSFIFETMPQVLLLVEKLLLKRSCTFITVIMQTRPCSNQYRGRIA